MSRQATRREREDGPARVEKAASRFEVHGYLGRPHVSHHRWERMDQRLTRGRGLSIVRTIRNRPRRDLSCRARPSMDPGLSRAMGGRCATACLAFSPTLALLNLQLTEFKGRVRVESHSLCHSK